MNVALGATQAALAASGRVGERDVADLTEVRRLHRACKSVLGKFVSRQFTVVSGSALRRAHFKVQTVKAGHPQKIQDTIPCFLRSISRQFGRVLAVFQGASRFPQGIALLQVFAAVFLAFAADDSDARLDELA